MLTLTRFCAQDLANLMLMAMPWRSEYWCNSQSQSQRSSQHSATLSQLAARVRAKTTAQTRADVIYRIAEAIVREAQSFVSVRSDAVISAVATPQTSPYQSVSKRVLNSGDSAAVFAPVSAPADDSSKRVQFRELAGHAVADGDDFDDDDVDMVGNDHDSFDEGGDDGDSAVSAQLSDDEEDDDDRYASVNDTDRGVDDGDDVDVMTVTHRTDQTETPAQAHRRRHGELLALQRMMTGFVDGRGDAADAGSASADQTLEAIPTLTPFKAGAHDTILHPQYYRLYHDNQDVACALPCASQLDVSVARRLTFQSTQEVAASAVHCRCAVDAIAVDGDYDMGVKDVLAAVACQVAVTWEFVFASVSHPAVDASGDSCGACGGSVDILKPRILHNSVTGPMDKLFPAQVNKTLIGVHLRWGLSRHQQGYVQLPVINDSPPPPSHWHASSVNMSGVCLSQRLAMRIAAYVGVVPQQSDPAGSPGCVLACVSKQWRDCVTATRRLVLQSALISRWSCVQRLFGNGKIVKVHPDVKGELVVLRRLGLVVCGPLVDYQVAHWMLCPDDHIDMSVSAVAASVIHKQ